MGLQKDLEILLREEDGIKLRKALASGKSIREENDTARIGKIDQAMRNELKRMIG